MEIANGLPAQTGTLLNGHIWMGRLGRNVRCVQYMGKSVWKWPNRNNLAGVNWKCIHAACFTHAISGWGLQTLRAYNGRLSICRFRRNALRAARACVEVAADHHPDSPRKIRLFISTIVTQIAMSRRIAKVGCGGVVHSG